LTKVKRKPIQKCKQKSLKLSRTSSNTSTSIHKKTRIVEEVNDVVTSDEKWLSFNRISTNLIKRKTFEDTAENTPTNSSKGMIGPLTVSERLEKVLKYLQKKRMKSTMKKFCYKCRKQVAEKRLRIKGRFVTKQ
jgi:hypothetical protein